MHNKIILLKEAHPFLPTQQQYRSMQRFNLSFLYPSNIASICFFIFMRILFSCCLPSFICDKELSTNRACKFSRYSYCCLCLGSIAQPALFSQLNLMISMKGHLCLLGICANIQINLKVKAQKIIFDLFLFSSIYFYK